MMNSWFRVPKRKLDETVQVTPQTNWTPPKALPATVRLVIEHPPSMVEVRDALLAVKDAQLALLRAEGCWNAPQLEDALRSAKFFIAEATKRLAAGVAKRQDEVK